MPDNIEQIKLAVKEILREEGVQSARTFLLNRFGYSKEESDYYILNISRKYDNDSINLDKYDLQHDAIDPHSCSICSVQRKLLNKSVWQRFIDLFKK